MKRAAHSDNKKTHFQFTYEIQAPNLWFADTPERAGLSPAETLGDGKGEVDCRRHIQSRRNRRRREEHRLN